MVVDRISETGSQGSAVGWHSVSEPPEVSRKAEKPGISSQRFCIFHARDSVKALTDLSPLSQKASAKRTCAIGSR